MSETLLVNNMTATYELKGYKETSVDVEFTVGKYENSDFNVEFDIRATKRSEVPIEFTVVYGKQSVINVEFQLIVSSNIDIEFEINPHNKMSVLYDLVEPPTSTYSGFPVQDTFVSSNSPYNVINYGSNNSMKIGQDYTGDNIGFVQFDTSSIPSDSIIKTAKMRLYYSNYNGQIMEVYRILSSWNEYSLTYKSFNNQLQSVSNSMVVNEVDRYIEFDITNIASQWIKGLTNNGLAIKSNDAPSVFRTREFPLSPELNIIYYTSEPYSANSSKMHVEFEVKRIEESSIDVEFDVHSNFSESSIVIEFYAHNPDTVFTEDIQVEFDINSYTMDKSIDIEFLIANNLTSTIDVEFDIPQYNGESSVNVEFEIKPKYTQQFSKMDMEFNISQYIANSNIDVEFDVTGGYTKSESNINIEFEIPSYNGESNVNVEFEIAVAVDNSIDVEFEINSYDKSSDMQVEFDVPVRELYDRILVEFGILGYGESSVNVEFYPRVQVISDLMVEFDVKRKVSKTFVFMI